MTYSQMREAGLCTRCGKPSKKSLCADCMNKQKKYQQENIRFFREIGLCKCGKKPAKGKRYCDDCLSKAKDWYETKGRQNYKKRRETLKSEGICVVCGVNKAKNGVKCEQCVKKAKAYYYGVLYAKI